MNRAFRFSWVPKRNRVPAGNIDFFRQSEPWPNEVGKKEIKWNKGEIF